MFSTKKRFIAGAVCPRCAEMDKIVAYREGDADYRECVSCGFKEELRIQSQPRELETRVNRTEAEKKAETQVVKLVDPTRK
ncbi:YheV family putative zinc ribbon protein [Porticoccaceae bacterium LTM1]|nr:YheV family putative zinc ribbon protein [Porticoccaceae bacterium LTM1]